MAVQARYAKGYTVIELMAVLAIASALLVIAIPMFRTQVQNARMTAAATDLFSTLSSARAEAVGRNYPVKVCISNNTVEDYDCIVDNNHWENGWLAFVDINDNGAVDEGEQILKIHAPLPDEMTVRGTDTLGSSVVFRPNGRAQMDDTQGIILCDARNYEASRILIISLLGKVSILRAGETGDILAAAQADKGNCLRGNDE